MRSATACTMVVVLGGRGECVLVILVNYEYECSTNPVASNAKTRTFESRAHLSEPRNESGPRVSERGGRDEARPKGERRERGRPLSPDV